MWFLVWSLLQIALLICKVLRLKTICNFESKRGYVHLSFKYDVWALVSAFLIYEMKIKCTWLHQSPMIYILSVVVAKSISSSFSKFLYCLKGEQLQLQLHLLFTYLLFQIHFPIDLSLAKSISSNFSKFLYCLKGEQLQLHLLFTYLLFQIHFPIDLLSFFYLIKILSLHYFFILSLSFLYFYIFQISNDYIFKRQNLGIVPYVLFFKFPF